MLLGELEHLKIKTRLIGEMFVSVMGFISTVRPNLPQPTHRLEEEITLRIILFLRLKVIHLHP